jgi:uncharacterized protein (TIGR00255 family)
MNSMTGYGRATGVVGAQSITVQANSVNRKTLDLTVALPDAWEALEPAVLEVVRRNVIRGKVHVSVEVTGQSGAADFDSTAVDTTLERLSNLSAARGMPFEPTTELLWQIVNSQRRETSLPAADEAAAAVQQAVEAALQGLTAMRAKEGGALLVDFNGRLEKLREYAGAIAQRAPQVTGVYRELLMQRLRVAGLELDLSDERVLKEVALFADRCDVTEEITRLQSHFAQLKDLLHSSGEIGRKAEFILQEIGREIHTIGSKANDLAISQRVIEFKNELERVREQMANVE